MPGIIDTTTPMQPLAVVGFAMRYPEDVTTPESFWQMLNERRCASTRYPADRLNIDAHYHPDKTRLDTLSVQGGHFIKGDMGAFDAPFFSVTAAEAEGMDPQQRMALETTYHALENAGISIDKISGSQTCVFSGCSANDYSTFNAKDPQTPAKYAAFGQAMCMISNRISWFYNMRGPSANVDTACSSSLVALDMACQSIRSGASSMGVVLGINLMFAREWTNSLDNLGFFSSDDRCFSFDSRANGYARGEGLGALIIKPVQDAIRDGDTIRAVIRSTLSNQDGRTPGITQPSRQAQQSLIEEAYRQAGLSPAATRYFEAHGTGTPVGDPIETRAIGGVFRQHRSKESPLYIGSVKSNIGHLEGGSGVAGVIKTILALERGIIPPVSGNFEAINPKIDTEHLNLEVVSTPTPWPRGLRRASVNSFGFGGANSHAILEDAHHFLLHAGLEGFHNTVIEPPSQRQQKNIANGNHVNWDHVNGDYTNGNYVNGTAGESHEEASNGTVTELVVNGDHPKPNPRVLTWSAADETGISRLAEVWKQYFNNFSLSENEAGPFIENLAYTLNTRRSRLPWTAYAIVNPEDDIKHIGAKWSSPIRSKSSPKLGFVFTGQGAQWATMGRELLTCYPVFRNSLVMAGMYLRSIGCSWDLLEELGKSYSESSINEPTFAQPLCTAIQVALVDLMQSFGVIPEAVVGHSSGEIAAAYCSGAISQEYAWKLAYYRGACAAMLAATSTTDGTMMAVGLSAEDAKPYLERLTENGDMLRVTVACVNSPKGVTLSGLRHQIVTLKKWLDEDKVFARMLPIPVAYHSFQMEEIAGKYRLSVGDCPSVPQDASSKKCRMVSSVTGDWVVGEQLSKANYWVKNLVSPVQFLGALEKICAAASTPPTKKLDGSHHKFLSVDTLVEIGPHAAMRGPVRDTLRRLGQDKKIGYLSALMRKTNAIQTTLDAVSELYCLGYPVDLSIVNSTYSGEKSATGSLKVLSDLPSYSFNHTKSYWHEGRVSKGFRFRQYGRHEMLGWQDDDWNPLQAKWSNFLQPSDPVWVKDHKINNTIILPGASMVTMAIEAVKQVTDPKEVITGFNLKNINFLSALKVPTDGSGIETRFYMQPRQGDGWYDFTLCNYNGEWIKNCTGSIQAVRQRPANPVDNGRVARRTQALEISAFSAMQDACPEVLDAAHYYKMLGSYGYQFGPTFSTVEGIVTDTENQLITQIKTYETDSALTFNETYTIHPTTLDGLMQTTPLLRSQGGRKQIPVSIPVHIGEAWISNSGLDYASTDLINVGTTIHHIGRQESVSSIAALNKAQDELLITMAGVTFAAVGSNESGNNDEEASTGPLCHNIEWKPDLDLLSPSEIQQLCDEAGPEASSQEGPMAFYLNVDLMITGFIVRAVAALNNTGAELAGHLRGYQTWLMDQYKALQTGLSPFSSAFWQAKIKDDAEFERFCSRLEGLNEQGKLFATVGRNLLAFASGKTTSSNIVPFDLVCRSTDEMWEKLACAQRWKPYLDALAHKSPGMKVLELSSDMGSIAHQMVKALGDEDADSHRAPRYARFDVANSSSSQLTTIQKQFDDFGPRVSFQTFDANDDPNDQGIEVGTYDLVVATLSLHATKSLEASLKNVRKLLKPGGKLIIIEVTNSETFRNGFLFGSLERWWQGTEPFRKASPCVNEGKWEQVLLETSFSGSEMSMVDYTNPACHEITMIVSTAIAPEETSVTISNVALLFDPSTAEQKSLVETVEHRLKSSESCSVQQWSVHEGLPNQVPEDLVCVVLLEVGQPVLADLDPKLFKLLQYLPSVAHRIIWVGSGGDVRSSPGFRVVDGLFRVLNSEDSRGIFTTLSLEGNSQTDADKSQKIHKVMRAMFSSPEPETEYVEKDGRLQINRLVEATGLDRAVGQSQDTKTMQLQPWNCGSALKLSIGSPGLLDSLHFVEDKDRDLPLQPHMLEVKVQSVGVNFRDVLVALGRLDQTTVGFECSGIVTRVGSDCGDFKPGDRVTGCEFDTYRSHVRLQRDTAVKMPDGMSFAAGAAIPINFITAWHAFAQVARLEPGETVLIHSATGGTGQAAIQVAQYLGANVIATAGSIQKKQLLMDRYGIPEERIFSSRDVQFAAGVKQVTGGQGVDVVLNSLSGDLLAASWECIAPYGRFVEIGKTDILAHRSLDMYHFARNVGFNAIDVAMMVKERPRLVGRALRAVMPLIADGTFTLPGPQHVYGIGELETALRTLQGGQSSGKVVLEMRHDDLVQTILPPQPSYAFNPACTYVIAGGLGGLGRGISRWLVSRGARHLLLLSRSGPKSQEAQSLIQELTDQGARVVAPVCDITSQSAMEAVLGELSCTMPPIKGCIQATMVLRDTMFEQMTFQQWEEAAAPKIQGSWNLHQLLPRKLDFFVMLSSISSIMGNRGQANYAAANTYMDGLAHYRTAMGEKAVSLNLGFFLSAGVVKETAALQDRYASDLLFRPVAEPELYAVLDYYCDPCREAPSDKTSQAIVGIGITKKLQERGLDTAYWLEKPAFKHLVAAESGDAGSSTSSSGTQISSDFAAADSLASASAIVTDALVAKLAKTLAVSKEEFDVNKPMHSYGVDSLVAVELRNWFAKELKAEIAIFNMLGGATIANVGALAASKSFSGKA